MKENKIHMTKEIHQFLLQVHSSAHHLLLLHIFSYLLVFWPLTCRNSEILPSGLDKLIWIFHLSHTHRCLDLLPADGWWVGRPPWVQPQRPHVHQTHQSRPHVGWLQWPSTPIKNHTQRLARVPSTPATTHPKAAYSDLQHQQQTHQKAGYSHLQHQQTNKKHPKAGYSDLQHQQQTHPKAGYSPFNTNKHTQRLATVTFNTNNTPKGWLQWPSTPTTKTPKGWLQSLQHQQQTHPKAGYSDLQH